MGPHASESGYSIKLSANVKLAGLQMAMINVLYPARTNAMVSLSCRKLEHLSKHIQASSWSDRSDSETEATFALSCVLTTVNK